MNCRESQTSERWRSGSKPDFEFTTEAQRHRDTEKDQIIEVLRLSTARIQKSNKASSFLCESGSLW